MILQLVGNWYRHETDGFLFTWPGTSLRVRSSIIL